MTGKETVDPLVGTKIGPCRVETRLAAGGMGVVYRARHTRLEQDVALKILAPSLAADQEYVTRFFREAGAAGQIDHPNVVRVIDVGKQDDKYYLVMEYVSGETLDRILDRERRLSLERATRLVREIAAGLAAAHRAGIIHRDVKPGNVIVSPDGRPHLTDFGLARHTETRKGLTVEGTFLGTPEYASPEQVEGRRLDHRTDLYSLGVTYYQLLSGALPFLGESPMEMAIKRTKEDPRPLEHAFPAADPRACAIVRKLLQLEPGQRHQNATEVIRDLDAILAGQAPPSVRKSETTTSTRAPLVTVAAKRRIRTFVHWDLATTAIAFAFFSGGLAARGAEFLETWSARDADLTLRIALAVCSALAGGGAVFVYRREFASTGRVLLLVLLVVLMLLLSLVAGAMIDRNPGSTVTVTLANSVRALVGSLGEPVSRIAYGLLLLFGAALVSFENQRGALRVVLCRAFVLAGFFLVYWFGAARGLSAPFGNFMAGPELSIPLATGVVLAGFFGAILLTGFNFEKGARVLGLALSIGAAAGLYAFAILVSQPDLRDSWTALLAKPFTDLGKSARQHGALMVGVIAIGLVEQSLAAAGMRRQDRFYRRKP